MSHPLTSIRCANILITYFTHYVDACDFCVELSIPESVLKQNITTPQRLVMSRYLDLLQNMCRGKVYHGWVKIENRLKLNKTYLNNNFFKFIAFLCFIFYHKPLLFF